MLNRTFRSLALTALAAACGGWPAFFGSAGKEVIEAVYQQLEGRKAHLEHILQRVSGALATFALAEGVDPATAERVMGKAEGIFRRHVLTAAELVALRLDPEEAAEKVWVAATASKAHESLDEDLPRVRQAIETVYRALLKDGKALPGLEQEFRRAVLEALADTRKIPDDTVAAFRQAQASMLLVDPTQIWRSDIYAPSTLLQAAFRIVPFHGRSSYCEEIESWCECGDDFGIRLFTGPGGTGKTRLFIELCSQLRIKGWHTGFLDKLVFKDAAIIDRLFEDTRSLLIVIDYAETRREEVALLLSRASRKLGGRSIRFALLSRNVGDWWHELGRAGNNVGALLTGQKCSISPVPQLASAINERSPLFHKAFAAFRSALDENSAVAEDVAPPDLSDAYFAAALFLHMTALLAADQGKAISDPAKVMEEIAKRERRFWDEGIVSAGAPTLAGRPILQAAALTTLAGGADDRDAAMDLIARAPLVRKQNVGEVDRVAELLHRCYPGERWLEGVTPDLLGEYLVARALEDGPALLTAAVFPQAEQTQIAHVLTVLTRMAKNEAEAESWLARAIACDLKRLAEPAMAVAIETGDPVGQVLAKVLLEKSDGGLSAELEGKMPHQTVALREAAWAATAVCHAALSHVSDTENEELKLERARVANNLANRLSDLGQRETALQAAQEATDLYRALAETKPDAFQPDLAMSLGNLANKLRDLGQFEEALKAAQEAVDIRCTLAEARPGTFQPDLAMSLNNLAAMLSDLGQREAALEAAQEAADLYRALAEARPGAFQANLAAALNNLATMFHRLGKLEAAFEAAQEAVGIFRTFAQARPDAFQPSLAGSFSNLANRLADLGRHEEALETAREAADLYRALAETRPGAFQPDLAMSLNNLANRLGDLGQYETALEAAREAADLNRALAEARPDAFQADLAMSLDNLAMRLSELRQREAALEAAREAADLNRALAEARPGAFQANLAGSLNNLANRLSELGQCEAALKAAREAADLYRALAKARPDSFQAELAMSLNNLAIRLSELGQCEAALKGAREAADLYRALAEVRPDSFRPKLARSLHTLSLCLKALDRKEKAFLSLKEGIEALSPSFLRTPSALAETMAQLCSDYRSLAEELDQKPDDELLGRIVEELRSLGGDEGKPKS